MDRKKLIMFFIGAILGFLVSMAPAPPPLTSKAMIAVAFLVAAIFWMITDALPDYVAILTMSIGWVVTKCAPMNIVFGVFSTATWWLLLGALAIGVAASESGLLKRISLYIMRLFPVNFKGQSLALVTVGLVTGPLIPSTAAKCAITGPIAKSISDALGFAEKSKGSAGLFAAFLNGVLVSAPGFLSASFVGYTCLGLLPKGTQAISWINWFTYVWPWTLTTIILMVIIGLKMYKPEKETSFSKEYVTDQLKALGSWKPAEKTTFAVLLICLLLWMTERIHGVSSAMVACAGTCVLLGLNVYGRMEFRSKIAWDSIIFIGCIIGLADVFKTVGINDFIRDLIGPMITPVMSNIWVFVPVYCIMFFLMRLIIASWIASITICSLVLIPIAQTVGIHPFIIVFIAYSCVATWNVIYQNAPYITSHVATGNTMATQAQMLPYSIALMVCTTIGNMVCIPWWRMLGLLQ